MSVMHTVSAALWFLTDAIKCILLDLAVFYCVDKLSKVALSDCQAPSERKFVWLLESLALLGLSLILYYVHHPPIILWIFTMATLASAMLSDELGLVQYWEMLKNYWSEFKDQEEIGEQAIVSEANVGPNKMMSGQHKVAEDLLINNENSIDTSAIGKELKTLRYNEEKAMYELRVPTEHPRKRTKPSGTNLRRRSLHPRDIVTSASADGDSSHVTSVVGSLENFGNKVRNLFGLSRVESDGNVPPGLANSGRNLCFLNSVMQCVSRSPSLADELPEDIKCCRSKDRAQLQLLDAVALVAQQINVLPKDWQPRIIDSGDLIDAAASINPDLLSSDRQRQQQQDACELLTWLLSELHESLNDATSSANGRLDQDETLRKLKVVYGNISQPYRRLMVEECKDQISKAQGLSDPALAEPIQNLANTEWINHKMANASIVDELFTFQCVDQQMCSSCLTCMASTQTMTILSLPVPDQTSITDLNGCLKAFTALERLHGRDGLQCDKCQVASIKHTNSATPMVRTRSADKHSIDQAFTPMSPIQSTDLEKLSSTTSHCFLSSTPLPGKLSAPRLSQDLPSSKMLTEGFRRCLLRRLPQCLIIQLLRFNYNPFTKKVFKIHTPVDVTLSNWELSKFTYDSTVDREDMANVRKENTYSLYAACVHIGGDNTGSGHYMAYCKANDQQWYRFDDEQVHLIRNFNLEVEKTVFRENCYLLFYHRLHAETKVE